MIDEFKKLWKEEIRKQGQWITYQGRHLFIPETREPAGQRERVGITSFRQNPEKPLNRMVDAEAHLKDVEFKGAHTYIEAKFANETDFSIQKKEDVIGFYNELGKPTFEPSIAYSGRTKNVEKLKDTTAECVGGLKQNSALFFESDLTGADVLAKVKMPNISKERLGDLLLEHKIEGGTYRLGNKTFETGSFGGISPEIKSFVGAVQREDSGAGFSFERGKLDFIEKLTKKELKKADNSEREREVTLIFYPRGKISRK